MLNIEFQWYQNLPHVDLVADPAQFISPDDVLKSLRCMKNGKAAEPSGVVAELMNIIIRGGKVPASWRDSIIVSLIKGKGDALDWNNYQ